MEDLYLVTRSTHYEAGEGTSDWKHMIHGGSPDDAREVFHTLVKTWREEGSGSDWTAYLIHVPSWSVIERLEG